MGRIGILDLVVDHQLHHAPRHPVTGTTARRAATTIATISTCLNIPTIIFILSPFI